MMMRKTKEEAQKKRLQELGGVDLEMYDVQDFNRPEFLIKDSVNRQSWRKNEMSEKEREEIIIDSDSIQAEIDNVQKLLDVNIQKFHRLRLLDMDNVNMQSRRKNENERDRKKWSEDSNSIDVEMYDVEHLSRPRMLDLDVNNANKQSLRDLEYTVAGINRGDNWVSVNWPREGVGYWADTMMQPVSTVAPQPWKERRPPEEMKETRHRSRPSAQSRIGSINALPSQRKVRSEGPGTTNSRRVLPSSQSKPRRQSPSLPMSGFFPCVGAEGNSHDWKSRQPIMASMSFANAGDRRGRDVNFDPYTVHRSPWMSTGAQQYGVGRTTKAAAELVDGRFRREIDSTTVSGLETNSAVAKTSVATQTLSVVGTTNDVDAKLTVNAPTAPVVAASSSSSTSSADKTKQFLKLGTYNGATALEAFLCRFEICSRSNEQ